MPELGKYLKPLTDKNAQLVTRYIKNWADSAIFEMFSPHLTLCSLTADRSEMPNFSYTHPLCHIKTNIAVKNGLTIQRRNDFETTQKNNKFEML